MLQQVFLRCTVLLVCLLVGMPGALARENSRPAEWATPVKLANTSNLYQVSPDVFRAAQPGKKGMKALAGYGIKTIITLRAHHSDKNLLAGLPLTLVEIPTNTWSADNDAVVTKVLQAIRDAEKPVLIHCQHGADRTGTMVAMYRIVEQGWSKEAALEEMIKGGYGFHSIWKDLVTYIQQVDPERIKKALR